MNEGYLLVPFFKTGKFQSMQGDETEYTLQDLQEIEKRYNARQDKASIVIGHPAKGQEKPLGTVESVKIFNDKLFAFVDDVDPKFMKAFKLGAYRCCSVALQGLNIRHIGFLGACPPAIKGLGDTFIIKEENDIKELGLKLTDGEILSDVNEVTELETDEEFAEIIKIDRKNENFAEVKEYAFNDLDDDLDDLDDIDENTPPTDKKEPDYKKMYEELKIQYEKLLQEHNRILRENKELLAEKGESLEKKLLNMNGQGSSSATTDTEKNKSLETKQGVK